jgi:DNA-binding CsgD family transcriptional regulator/PAS domain-containing protein
MHGEVAALILNDYREQQYNLLATHNVPDEMNRLYTERYAAIDEYYIGGKNILRTGWCGPSQSLVSDGRLLTSEFYNDYQKQFDMFHACLAVPECDSRSLAALSVLRCQRRGAFETAQIDFLRMLLPHVQSALKAHRTMSDLVSSSAGMEAALERLSIAIILVGRNKILAMNRAARRIFARRDGLIATPVSLTAQLSHEADRLRQLVSNASDVSVGKGSAVSGAMLVSRQNDPPLQIFVTPICGSSFGFGLSVQAIVMVADPSQEVRPAQQVLKAMFGLTPAEIRVALLLSDGKSIQEIAQMLQVSRNTLKSQLASIYRKTNTSRQTQLVKLMTLIPSQDFGRVDDLG